MQQNRIEWLGNVGGDHSIQKPGMQIDEATAKAAITSAMGDQNLVLIATNATRGVHLD